ncbi:cAMP-dependent protein kinase catalytic subunit PRKX, partial [Camelus dromedarius]
VPPFFDDNAFGIYQKILAGKIDFPRHLISVSSSKPVPSSLDVFPPFFDDNAFGIYQKILAGKIDFPRHLDFSVKHLLVLGSSEDALMERPSSSKE